MPIKNPCSGLCNGPLRTDGICQACYRTVCEHAEWGSCDDERRIEILDNCKRRKFNSIWEGRYNRD